MIRFRFIVAAALALFAGLCPAAEKGPEVIKTSWGTITPQPHGEYRVEVTKPPLDWHVQLPTPFANITHPGSDHLLAAVTYNKDATRITLEIPPSSKDTDVVFLQIAEKTTQFDDGRIVLSALDATVNGDTAKLETHPGNHRIGFWTNEKDYVSWDYNATRWGMYNASLTYSLAAGESTVAVTIGDKTFKKTLKPTGSWYRYRTVSLGKTYLAEAGRQTFAVKPVKKTGGAVMNLKALTLDPTSEGKVLIDASDDGAILLHGKDATIHGTRLRWEPAEKKRTLGYWSNPNDTATWGFVVLDETRTYRVQIMQGCGKGHGGSTVAFEITGVEDKPHVLKHTVVDTGHWQNFKQMDIGTVTLEPGVYTFRVRPIEKKGVAVMDLQQVKLIPVKADGGENGK